jgi:tether containing UBX domain for GLUT4
MWLRRYKQKQVDLSGPYRTSGLGPGAKLELVAKSSSPTVINVALQFSGRDAAMIPNGRLTGKFPSNSTIWKVLRQFESGGASGGHNLNITARGVAQTSSGAANGGGQLYYESPMLNMMGRELNSFEDFQRTLSQCGINSGSVLIRVSFQTTGKTLFEAMQDISQYFKEMEEEPTGQKADPDAVATKPDDASPVAESASAPVNPGDSTSPLIQLGDTDLPDTQEITAQPTTVPEPTPAPAPEIPEDPLQPISIFSAPSGNTPQAALTQESDAVYTPSVAHAQLHQARLLAATQNKRLKSDAELAAEAAAEASRVAAVSSVGVRVRFPDGTSAEWRLPPTARGAAVYAAVRSVAAAATMPFSLALPGGGAVRDSDSGVADELVRGYGVRGGGVLLNLTLGDGVTADIRKRPFLKSSVAGLAKEVVVPKIPLGKDDEQDGAQGKVIRKDKDPLAGAAAAAGDLAKKLPKWLKLPGKK